MIHTSASAVLPPDPPRAVPRWFFVRRMQALFFSALLLTGLGLVLTVGVLGVFEALEADFRPFDDWALDRAAVRTTGVILEKKLITSVHMGSRHPWLIAFEFTLPDGRPARAAGYTYDDAFAHKNPGDDIEVEYSPGEPARARPVGGYVSFAPAWLFLILVVMLVAPALVGLILLVVLGVRVRAERVLLAQGTGVDAEVMRVAQVWYINFGLKHPCDVYYRFRDYCGVEIVGKDRTYHYDWAATLRPGDKVGVVYHPHAPEANALWLHAGTPQKQR